MAAANHHNLPKFNRYADSHKTPQGPGDSRPSALQIVEDEGMRDKLLGKTVLITGCSSGLGIATAQALALTGAKLVLTVRDVAKGQQVVDDLKKESPKRDFQQFELLQMDMDSLENVRKAAAEFLERNKQLNILIANAGIGGASQAKTKEGFESHFGVNHLAHFLLFQLLAPTLVSSSTAVFQSRVVIVSSMIHRFTPVLTDDYNLEKMPYNPAIAYGNSKTANVWMANELERRYASKGVHSISLHPGGIITGLGSKHSPEFMEMMKGIASDPGLPTTFKDHSQGAATQVLAAIAKDFEGKGGFYLDDCAVAEEYDEKGKIYAPGYSPWAYDEQGEKTLWEDSLKFVGLEKDA